MPNVIITGAAGNMGQAMVKNLQVKGMMLSGCSVPVM